MWYVMSYNSITGYVSGAFQDLNTLFFSGSSGGECHWTVHIDEAKSYEHLRDAKQEVHLIWGERFANQTMAYVQFNDVDVDREDHARKQRIDRENTGRALAGRMITKETLIDLAQDTLSNRLTWRERWIIEIMMKED